MESYMEKGQICDEDRDTNNKITWSERIAK